jgi:mRNA interferase MazF
MNKLQKGDIILCVMSSDFGKVRPAIIMQNTDLITTTSTIIACPLTTQINENILNRPIIYADKKSGIKKTSQIMVDKICSIKITRIKSIIGKISKSDLALLNNSIKQWIDV